MLGGALSHLRSTRKLKSSSSTSPSVRPGLRRRLHLGISRTRQADTRVPTPAARSGPPKPWPGGAGPHTGHPGNRATASPTRWRPLAEAWGPASPPGPCTKCPAPAKGETRPGRGEEGRGEEGRGGARPGAGQGGARRAREEAAGWSQFSSNLVGVPQSSLLPEFRQEVTNYPGRPASHPALKCRVFSCI